MGRLAKVKQGAASFYIVAFSTLILLILAVSFATVVISEIERTSNDDLSQSAYDSAMAGVEDAKLAFYNYQSCKTKAFSSMSQECKQIVAIMESAEYQDCYMVGRILGRIEYDEEDEVMIDEYTGTGAGSNNMQQAYTCVKIQTILSDYRATLSASSPQKVVKVELDDGAQTGAGTTASSRIHAQDIKKVKISWYSGTDTKKYSNFSGGSVGFPQIGVNGAAVPPTISLALVQTAEEFALSDFETSVGNTTDRGMLYLVPSETEVLADGKNYKAAVGNKIAASAFANSNKQESQNLPYVVYCPKDSGNEFVCSVTIDLPEVVSHNGNATRSEDTFMFVVGLPYGRPATDFSLELFCADGKVCAHETIVNDDGTEDVVNTSQANFSGVQVKIDSTGRANDLYRRVEVRLESAADNAYVSLLGPLELVKSGDSSVDNDGLQKNYIVTKEWNIFTPTFVGRH